MRAYFFLLLVLSIFSAVSALSCSENEFLISCSTDNFSCSKDKACCSEQDSCVWDSACYSSNLSIIPDKLSCGTVLSCYSTIWQVSPSKEACSACGMWVDNLSICCSTEVFTFNDSICREGVVYSCSADGLCAELAGLDCEDPDCSGVHISLSLPEKVVEAGNAISLEYNLSSFENVSSFLVEYAVHNSSGIIYRSSTQRDNVSGVNSFSDSILPHLSIGDYNLTVKTVFDNETVSDIINFTIEGDCIIIDGPSDVIFVPGSPQDLRFLLINRCNVTVHNILIKLEDFNSSLNKLDEPALVTLQDVLLDNRSKPVLLSVYYDSGLSDDVIIFNAFTIENITSYFVRINESANDLFESINRNIRFLFIKRASALENYSVIKNLFAIALIELSLNNYAIAESSLSSVLTSLIALNDVISAHIRVQLIIILIFVFIIVIILIIKSRDFLMGKKIKPKSFQKSGGSFEVVGESADWKSNFYK